MTLRRPQRGSNACLIHIKAAHKRRDQLTRQIAEAITRQEANVKTVWLTTAAMGLALSASLAWAQPAQSQRDDQKKDKGGHTASSQQNQGGQGGHRNQGGQTGGQPGGGSGGGSGGGRQGGVAAGGQGGHHNQGGQTSGGATGTHQSGATSGGQGGHHNQGGQTSGGATGGHHGGSNWGGQGGRHNQGGQTPGGHQSGSTWGSQGNHHNQGGQPTGGSTGSHQSGTKWGGQRTRHDPGGGTTWGGQRAHIGRDVHRTWGDYRVGKVVHPRIHADRYLFPRDLPYRRFVRGDRLPRWDWIRRYYITDFVVLGLSPPPYGQRWVRYGPDAMLIDPSTGEVMDNVYGVYDDGTVDQSPPVEPTIAPSQSWGPSSEKLYDNWNTYACDYTDTATLDVGRSMHLDRLDLWVNWGSDEQVINYRVLDRGEEIATGELRRGDCDPNQAAWCAATDTPASDLEPGRYTIQIDHDALCQNQTSGGDGFIRAWGNWR